MKYSVISALELSPEFVARWIALQRLDEQLVSPYFCPEFTQTVATVRGDVFVCLLEDRDGIAGFFPFHRMPGGVARPIGLGLSDYHGVVVKPDAEWAVDELLRGCKVERWAFDHLPVGQRHFSLYHRAVSDSPIIDVSRGIDAFEGSRDKSGRKQLREISRKRRKIEEKYGPLSFSLHVPDQAVLKQLMEWKSLQCKTTGTIDFFAVDWCAKLVERIHGIRERRFGGMLACLHAGDMLAAAHFVMYSEKVWHSWFPAYNHDLEEYSPGFILLLDMIKAACDTQISYIDLGKGVSRYKKQVMTGSIQVAEGYVALPSVRNTLRDLREHVERWEKHPAFRPILLIPGKVLRRIDRSRRYG